MAYNWGKAKAHLLFQDRLKIISIGVIFFFENQAKAPSITHEWNHMVIYRNFPKRYSQLVISQQLTVKQNAYHVYAIKLILEMVSNVRLTVAQGCVQRKLVGSSKHVENSLNSLHGSFLDRQALNEDKSASGFYKGTLKVMICKLLFYFQLNGKQNIDSVFLRN